LAAVLGGMLIVFWIARRRSAKAAASSATATSAGAGPETFQCPSCQKRLKASSADMNRNVRCPACQTTFNPAASQAPLAR
jgi:tRNA(Ile2) C34 agmatinyltransferase TiaS